MHYAVSSRKTESAPTSSPRVPPRISSEPAFVVSYSFFFDLWFFEVAFGAALGQANPKAFRRAPERNSVLHRVVFKKFGSSSPSLPSESDFGPAGGEAPRPGLSSNCLWPKYSPKNQSFWYPCLKTNTKGGSTERILSAL